MSSAVELNHIDYGGEGTPIVLLHGLFGSARNWGRAAELLNDSFHVYALDLRNHGESPHTPTHGTDEMVVDVLKWCDDHGIDSPLLIGHSMGGIAAMVAALEHPDRFACLGVVDIAPRQYETGHFGPFEALKMDFANFKTRAEIDEAMAEHVSDKSTRQFLQTNLKRRKEGGFRRIVNIDALEKADYGKIFQEKTFEPYSGRALFIRGGDSDYLIDEDEPKIRSLFPRSTVITIEGAGHWLHHTHAERFVDELTDWAKSG